MMSSFRFDPGSGGAAPSAGRQRGAEPPCSVLLDGAVVEGAVDEGASAGGAVVLGGGVAGEDAAGGVLVCGGGADMPASLPLPHAASSGMVSRATSTPLGMVLNVMVYAPQP
ncbi:hypothetical protein [Azoarcus sp. KH32C]|uniref:hypothetical protein n=1 Tax=Azoarcus sp. KH32C TaxID=748247 RepID=UPI0005A013F4|nr:hypothetical protein [Azoarcus sp. KH32C]